MRRLRLRSFFRWILAAVALVTLAGCGGGGGGGSAHRYTRHQAYISQTNSLKALVYLPKDYAADSTKRWPMILYLHGSSQRGHDLDQLVLGLGIPARIEQGFDPPFIVVSPQCPSSAAWSNPSMLANLSGLIQELQSVYRIDPRRVNLTGFSMGGDGAWALAIAHPQLFSAVAPVGANAYDPKVVVLKDKPLWVFHGQNDTTCPIANSVAMVQALREAGSTTVKFTLWPNADHMQSCTLTYLEDTDDNLYQWLAAQTRP